jgi:hypothetical protein
MADAPLPSATDDGHDALDGHPKYEKIRDLDKGESPPAPPPPPPPSARLDP